MKSIRLAFALTIGAMGCVLSLQAQDPLTNGLVAYYPLNGNANDESGNGHHGVAHGAILTNGVDGLPGSALAVYGYNTNHIDGSGIQLSNSSLSVAFWVRRDGNPSSPIESWTIALGLEGAAGKALRIYQLDNVSALRFSFWFDDFDAPIESVGDSGWTHVACTYDRDTQERKVFIDGLPIATNIANYGYTGGTDFHFGAHHLTSYDQIRFYDRALSDVEVMQLYTYEGNPLPYLSVAVKTIRVSMYVEPGKTYQLESSPDNTTWSPVGSPFVALFSIIHQDVDVEAGNRFFRVYEVAAE